MIVLSPKKISLALMSGAVFLALMNVVSDVYRQVAGSELRFTQIFKFDDKVNIPTWYSSCLLLGIALLMLAIAVNTPRQQNRYALHWGVLSGLFLLLSLDEVAAIHLRFDFITRYMLHLGSWRYGLLLLLTGAIAAVVWIYRKFFVYLPAESRWQCAIAAGFYGAAIVVDRAGKILFKQISSIRVDPWLSLLTNLLDTVVDELFELIGLTVLIYALLSYIRMNIKELHIRIDAQ